MKKKIKKLWLAALRSGQYGQTRKHLRHNGRYCCLGVLCDLHAKETGNEWSKDDSYFNEYELLPIDVCKWAGLDTKDRRVRISHPDGNSSVTSLVVLNDVLHEDFEQIADVIETHL